MIDDLTNLDKHFRFGDNWLRFVESIDEKVIKSAEKGFNKLISTEAIKGKSLLDIGCGSGLHSLAALNQGAKSVLAVDIDPVCLDATRNVLSRHYDGDNWQCKDVSVFDLTRAEYGTFDIVYSWGVLHHTGDMYNAISKVLDMVSPGGLCVLALYRRTRLCGFWRLEKKFYSGSSQFRQYLARRLYIALYRLRCLVKGVSMKQEIRDYYKKRGMNFYHDIHDWLGGYPYESTTPQELQRHVDAFGGFRLLQCFECKSSRMGIFGTDCDQFVFQRTSSP